MTMRITIYAVAALGAVALAAPEAHAQRLSPMPAGNFMRFCSTPANGGQKVCDAYITGMADSFALAQALSPEASTAKSICVPTETTGTAMRQTVVSWIGNHKDRLRNKVGEVVYTALHESYPCSATKSGS